MPRLIDADALPYRVVKFEYGQATEAVLKHDVDAAPAVDPERHAVWERVEFTEHDWALRSDGVVDEYAFENGFHNGPICKMCGHSYCVHCEPGGIEEPCIIVRCSSCHEDPVYGRRTTYCPNCGARTLAKEEAP